MKMYELIEILNKFNENADVIVSVNDVAEEFKIYYKSSGDRNTVIFKLSDKANKDEILRLKLEIERMKVNSILSDDSDNEKINLLKKEISRLSINEVRRELYTDYDTERIKSAARMELYKEIVKSVLPKYFDENEELCFSIGIDIYEKIKEKEESND